MSRLVHKQRRYCRICKNCNFLVPVLYIRALVIMIGASSNQETYHRKLSKPKFKVLVYLSPAISRFTLSSDTPCMCVFKDRQIKFLNQCKLTNAMENSNAENMMFLVLSYVALRINSKYSYYYANSSLPWNILR